MIPFINTIRLFLLYAIVITIVISKLNLNSICIVLLILTWLIEGNFKSRWRSLKKDKLFIAYTLFLVIQLAGITMSENFKDGWKDLESKLGFIALPLVFCSSGFVDRDMRKKVMLVFSISLTIAALFCICAAALRYAASQDTIVFFYHELVSPLDHHAVYFSVYMFISLVFVMADLADSSWLKKNRFLHVLWILFYLLFIFFLSSKMVLLVTALYLIYWFIRSETHIKSRFSRNLIAGISILLIVVAISVTDNPVKKRFADLKGDIELLSLNEYNDAMYFNGWQFRLLLWRFTYEIIRDRKAWITGVGPSNDQAALQKKYLDMGLYGGLASRGDRGYLDFNCHNQFLQSFLESGIPGLLVFIGWCWIFIQKVIRKKQAVLSWMTIIIFAFFFIESVFERQYGMILTTLFPLMYLYTTKPVNQKSQ
ncbi:MAG: O-antigen ligase family protein [Chitinophagaceae bacterium]|nr:O-antigen ligase family protein [Chitinophagaceae bacterium]